MKTCAWVIRPASKGCPAAYCGKKVSYTMVKDDWGQRYRKYNTFCNHHKSQEDDA